MCVCPMSMRVSRVAPVVRRVRACGVPCPAGARRVGPETLAVAGATSVAPSECHVWTCPLSPLSCYRRDDVWFHPARTRFRGPMRRETPQSESPHRTRDRSSVKMENPLSQCEHEIESRVTSQAHQPTRTDVARATTPSSRLHTARGGSGAFGFAPGLGEQPGSDPDRRQPSGPAKRHAYTSRTHALTGRSTSTAQYAVHIIKYKSMGWRCCAHVMP